MIDKLNQPWGGYYQRLTLEDDAELTRVGPGTPCGEYLRRFWHPIALASEIEDVPLGIRVLGEDLVLFRDRGGRVGLLHRHCSHRGTSLEYGILSERGLRCCYHGWLYAVDGTVLETPGEPEGSRIAQSFRHGAYRTHEHAGLVFAYMGPPEETPDFPVLDTLLHPAGNRLVPYKLFFPCNWLQSHENGADPVHTAFLHAIVSGVQFTPAFSAVPSIEFLETPIGLLAIATRRWQDRLWIRASDVILPNAAQFGSGFIAADFDKFALAAYVTRWVVPIDDTNCWTIGYRHFNPLIDPRNEGREDLIGLGKVDFMGQTAERPFKDRQRQPGDWDAQVAQRPIAVHANEHLGATDQGVAMLRRDLLRGIRAVKDGRKLERPQRYGKDPVPTYNHEVVATVPARADRDERAVLRSFGRGVAGVVIGSAGEPVGPRQQNLETHVRALVAREFS